MGTLIALQRPSQVHIILPAMLGQAGRITGGASLHKHILRPP